MNTTIRGLIRQELETSKDLQPRDVARRIIDGLTPKQLDEALEEALPALVSDVILSTRRVRVTGTQARPKPTSWKRDGIRTLWERELRAVYSAADGTMKRLADFTYDDMCGLADECRSQAAAKAAAADKWDLLGKAMLAIDAPTLSAVPADTLATILGGGE